MYGQQIKLINIFKLVTKFTYKIPTFTDRIQPMSSLQNNASNAFFTEANLSVTHEYNSLTLRKSYNGKDDKPTGYSSILYKGKQSLSKQRLISPQLENIISKIQTFVQDIDNKIQNRVQLVKQVYVNEYKEQVLEMSAQLKHLREKLDNEVMKERANQKMFYLQEERDFFRHQVIKLNEQMNKLNDQNKGVKKMLQEEKRESANYKKIVYGLEEKILKLKNVNIQRNMLLTSSSKDPLEKTFKHSSTIDSNNHFSGAKTQRVYNKPTKSLQTIEDESQRQMSRTGYRLNPSHSVKAYSKLSTPIRQPMRSTVTYPKLTVEKLQKIEGYSELLERQRIVDECINELKREIYYRNLSVGDRQTKIHFGQTNQVRFESFTKTDKKQLIIKLLSNEKILNQFYQFLFNPNPLTNNASRNPEDELAPTTELINSKLDLNGSNGLGSNKWSLKKLNPTNPKFNTQLLTGVKTQFSKKIFDIKHSNR